MVFYIFIALCVTVLHSEHGYARADHKSRVIN